MGARESEKGEWGRKMDKRLGQGGSRGKEMELAPTSVSAPQGTTMMMASIRNFFFLAQSDGSKIDLKYGGPVDEALVLLPPTPPKKPNTCYNHS